MGEMYKMACSIIYDKGFSGNDNIIARHDNVIKKIILDKLGDRDIFVNTTWLELDNDLIKILEKDTDRIICYSGPDWENTSCRTEPNKFIDTHHSNVIRIGNTLGNYYFSFWLDFVFTYRNDFERFDCWDLDNNLKTFMCLNRKPHAHRVELVKRLYELNLTEKNYVSLGMHGKPIPWDYQNLPVPIKLHIDIINEHGDLSVAGTAGGITNDITGLGHSKNWNSHFLNIVTETTIHTDVFLSEKIFKPILGLRPFVVLGDYNIYNVLKDWGIDTFDDIFGTGYKQKYYTERIDWIVDLVNTLEKEPNLKKLLISLKSRLEKNKKIFTDIALKNRLKIHDLEI